MGGLEHASDFLPLSVSFSSYFCKMENIKRELVVKNPPATARDITDAVQSLGRKDPLEDSMATLSCILAWRVPWTEEPGGLQSTESQRVGYD